MKGFNIALKISQWLLWTMTIYVLSFFIIAEIVLPAETSSNIENCQTFQAEWVQILPDGTRQPVKIPGQCQGKRGEVITIETTFPEDTKDTWCSIRSGQQDLKIYVGEELREEYSTKDTRLYGKNSTSAYIFFPVFEKDANKTLRIESVSDSAYSGHINEIDMGNKLDIWMKYFKLYLPGTLAAGFMLILSFIVVCFSSALWIIYKKRLEISYLGIGLLLASIWLLTESKLRQLIIPNGTIASNVGFWMVMLLPYPFLSYIDRVQKHRYQKAYTIVAICAALNFIFSTALQFLNIKDFFEIMGISHAIIGILCVISISTIILDIRKGYIKEYFEVALGFLGIAFCSVWEIFLAYQTDSMYNGLVLCVGLVFLLFVAILKTGKDMMMIEKEKQMAIISSESKAMFLANMSHEIRTPINTVIGMNEMILRENKNEEIQEYAQNIYSASRMLLGLINDILDFSKIEAGKMEVINNSYKLQEILKDVILGVKKRAEDKELKFEVEVDKNLPSVLKGDEIRIKQILNNILSNAVKYTEKGSIYFTVLGKQQQDKFLLKVSVKDTGIGIKKEDMEHLFDSFQRLEVKKNRHVQGTGLGLCITKQLVKQMQGEIEVVSEYGNGSCFTVFIPQEVIDTTPIGELEGREMKSPSTEQNAESKLYAPNASVLVVDDNAMNLAVIKMLLKRSKIKLDFAKGGLECLDYCNKKKYDLILMDHMMPEPDGVQTLHLLQENTENINCNTPVIVLTANAIAGAAENYLKEGFVDYLAKPVEYQILEEMLCRFLEVEEFVEEETESLQELPFKEEVTPKEESQKCVTAINRNRGLIYCGGKEENYQQILRMFVEQGDTYLKELPKHCERQEWSQYAIATHAIKGTSVTIGAGEFSAAAKEHELAAKEKNAQFIQKNIGKFLTDYKSILDYVKKELLKE